MPQQKTKFIENQAITNAKMVNVSTSTFKGRTTAGTGSPEDLTSTQATALLNAVTTTLKGLVPAPTTNDAVENRFLKADGTFQMPLDPTLLWTFYDDFDAGAVGAFKLTNTSTGTGAALAVGFSGGNNSSPGMLQATTGTTTTGRGSAVGGFLQLGGGYAVYKTRIYINNLSDGTDTYTIDVGLHDQGSTSVAVQDGIFFSYDQTASTFWKTNTTNASTTTTTTTTTTVTAGAFIDLAFILNAANTSVTFYINGTSVATHTTNLPTASVKPALRIIKSAGTTARITSLDYKFVQIDFGGSR